MHLTVVAHVYNCSAAIREFHREVRAAAAEIAVNFEIVFVNDDSPDDSLEAARALVAEDDCVRVVDLSRTYGYDKAILTGLAHASGDLIFTAGYILPQSCQCLVPFHQRMRDSGADSVYAANAPGECRLMSRPFLDSLLRLRDREVHLPGLYAAIGYKQEAMAAPSLPLRRGRVRRWTAALESVAAYNTVPLVVISQLGTAIFVLSLAAGLGLIVDRLFFQRFLPGWPSLIVSIWVLGGLILFCLGVVALYLSKIFVETKDRPDTIVREVLRPGVRGE
jgi:putative glycosyltransferase